MYGVLAIAVTGGLAAAAIVGLDLASAAPARGAGCADVDVITARASTERPGEGITGALVTQIVNSSDQSVSRESVDYPATLQNYQRSSAQGVTALTKQLTDQVQQCPDQKIVLAGYSQGAHVVLDVLGGGGGGLLGAATPPIDPAIASHVSAVATFGDPRHVVDQAFDVGTSTKNGRFPRSAAQLQTLAGFADRVQAFCDARDTFCDSGVSTTVHLTYMNRYKDDATDFVLGKIGG
ncbi:cutinase family protein [Actinophytocola oryzae]|uniref:cutinase family protein n=1 Tax=Actinophytocola oryzae TaxID=502181 RepID=UPI0014152796|nr:cutinase family protein [Actinophytocola oryzae]